MKIAVVGSGISGLSSAFYLSKKHKVDMRKATMVLAVERVMEAFNQKGIWP